MILSIILVNGRSDSDLYSTFNKYIISHIQLHLSKWIKAIFLFDSLVITIILLSFDQYVMTDSLSRYRFIFLFRNFYYTRLFILVERTTSGEGGILMQTW